MKVGTRQDILPPPPPPRPSCRSVQRAESVTPMSRRRLSVMPSRLKRDDLHSERDDARPEILFL